jgi:hypothetical protein
MTRASSWLRGALPWLSANTKAWLVLLVDQEPSKSRYEIECLRQTPRADRAAPSDRSTMSANSTMPVPQTLLTRKRIYVSCSTSAFKAWCTGKDSNLRTSLGGTDLQSVGFNHSPTCAKTLGRCGCLAHRPTTQTKRNPPSGDTQTTTFSEQGNQGSRTRPAKITTRRKKSEG